MNILAPFNMQPELLCKDEDRAGGWVMGGNRERGEGLGMRGKWVLRVTVPGI